MKELTVGRRAETDARLRLLTILCCLSLLVGMGGMALSFAFLSSNDSLDVMAGAAGFVSGAILVSAATLSLAVMGNGKASAIAVQHSFVAILGMAPSVVAYASWPALYFGFFISGLMVMPGILILCGFLAAPMSGWTARSLLALFSPTSEFTARWTIRFHLAIFFFQVLAILASWPLFVVFLNMLQSHGIKTGWS